jgi:hypothetical protein
VRVIAAGTSLMLRGGPAPIALRVLADTPLGPDWRIPVLAGARALQLAGGEIDLPPELDQPPLPVRILVEDGLLVLRPRDGTRAEPALPQRRQDVRGPLHLPLRGTVLTGGETTVPEPDSFAGVTVSVSAGGLAVQLLPELTARPGRPDPAGPGPEDRLGRLYLELELPDGPLVPAVLTLVTPAPGDPRGHPGPLRGAFADIAAADRERLVRLVFREERRMLARRPGRGPARRW